MRLFDMLSLCNTEESVKAEFSKYFKFRIDSKDRFDHYSEEILYEFKLDKNLHSIKIRSLIIAQTLYYIRYLKHGQTRRPIPPFVCVVDKNEAFIYETKKYIEIYEKSKNFDWDRAPSTPCPNLVLAIENFPYTSEIYVYDLQVLFEEEQFINKRKDCLIKQLSFFDNDKKIIDEDNFLEVYDYWQTLFGKYVENGKKPSEYFIADIEEGRSQKFGENYVAFDLGDDNLRKKSIVMSDYDHFWALYEKVRDASIIQSIRQKIDRISEDYLRRFTGEFYTPIEYASRALRYIEKVIGPNWYKTGKWRLWDMAAGTGNLEFTLPSSALQYCYISTLLDDDANYCRRIFPDATVFQYDYLNDDVNTLIQQDLSSIRVKPKLPKNLYDDLRNPEIKWIVFINPPFATSNNTGKVTGKKSKDSVSTTEIRRMMSDEDMGETSRELYSQFLYRINREFSGKIAYLGLFSKLKYINSNNDQKMRDSFFQYYFESGFMFHSTEFFGSKGHFPVGFIIWNLKKKKPLSDQCITLDVFGNFAGEVGKYGTKTITAENRSTNLNKWVDRPRTERVMPPFSSAITIGLGKADTRDRVANDFVCSLMCCGNDFQHQNYTALLSGPYASAGAFSVTPGNFEKAMILHTVRRLPKSTWTNDRDQFRMPNANSFSNEFISNCAIWTAFSDSNETVALKNVAYKGSIYQIHNNMYPFRLDEIRSWQFGLDEIAVQMLSANENRFFASWIEKNMITPESMEILQSAYDIYKIFYLNVQKAHWKNYRIASWDVGWWQVRQTLKEIGIGKNEFARLKSAHYALGEKILPLIYQYGFLQKDVENYTLMLD